MGPIAALCLAVLLPQQPQPATAHRDAAAAAELLLLPDTAAAGVAAFGLGDGGIESGSGRLQVADGECLTPGGIHVRVQEQGVHVELPNGRQLLFAPDGHLHPRRGDPTGPFGGGATLHFADGSALRIDRSGSRRRPIQEVVVTAGERAERLWHRQRAVAEPVRPTAWTGVDLACAGDGDAIYRVIGTGPLLVLERLTAPPDCALPPVRLVLCTAPLLQSLRELAQGFDRAEPALQPSLLRLHRLAARGEQLFEQTLPTCIDRRRLRFALARGHDLSFELADDGSIRLGLHGGDAASPLVEWTLGHRCDVHLVQPGLRFDRGSRYAGAAVRLAAATPFQARAELLELPAARAAIERLRR